MDLPASIRPHITLSAFPGLSPEAALDAALARPDLGSTRHVQICPQNRGALDGERLDRLLEAAPATEFRLHANVHAPEHGHRFFDAGTDWDTSSGYFSELARINARLGSPHYTLHAGRRRDDGKQLLTDNLHRLEDLFQTRVGVEGLYPAQEADHELSTWRDYAWLLESGLDYALDLSHLHIVATAERRVDLALTRELLASPHLIECHLSGNDGLSDQHCALAISPRYWWHACLDALTPGAVIFYEGQENRGPLATSRLVERFERRGILAAASGDWSLLRPLRRGIDD